MIGTASDTLLRTLIGQPISLGLHSAQSAMVPTDQTTYPCNAAELKGNGQSGKVGTPVLLNHVEDAHQGTV